MQFRKLTNKKTLLIRTLVLSGVSLQAFLIIQRYEHMSVLFILIGVSLLVALGFLGAFLWATASGQYDDDETPARRMLFDDTNKNKSQQER